MNVFPEMNIVSLSVNFVYFCILVQMMLNRIQNTKPSEQIQRCSTPQNRTLTRPQSGIRTGSRPSSSKYRPDPTFNGDSEVYSRPGTVFATRPDDDNIATWNDSIDD